MEVFFRNNERIEILLKRGEELAKTLNQVRTQYEALELPVLFNDQILQDLMQWEVNVPEYIRGLLDLPTATVGKIITNVPVADISGLDFLIEALNRARVESLYNFPINLFGIQDGKVVFLGKDQVEKENTVYAQTKEEIELLHNTQKLHKALTDYLNLYPNLRFPEVFEISRNQVTLNTRYLPSMLTGARAPIAKKPKTQLTH